MFFILILIAGLYSINYHSIAFLTSWVFLILTIIASIYFIYNLKEHDKPTFNFSSFFTHLIILGIYIVLYKKEATFLYYLPILSSQLITLVISFYYWFSSNSNIKSSEDNFIDSLKK